MGDSEISAEEEAGNTSFGGRFDRGAAERIRGRTFPVVMRGYDRAAVDAFLEEVADLVAHLESRQSREAVVQRALDEVGEETAGILQRAHETADEITARSRAQAEARIERAEREAEIARREADEYAEQVVTDTRLLWEERQRLLEDIRQLADEVLATADEAAERVTLPEAIAEPEAVAERAPEGVEPSSAAADQPTELTDQPTELSDQPTELTDPPTAEVELNVLPGGAGEQSELEEETQEAEFEGAPQDPESEGTVEYDVPEFEAPEGIEYDPDAGAEEEPPEGERA